MIGKTQNIAVLLMPAEHEGSVTTGPQWQTCLEEVIFSIFCNIDNETVNVCTTKCKLNTTYGCTIRHVYELVHFWMIISDFTER